MKAGSLHLVRNFRPRGLSVFALAATFTRATTLATIARSSFASNRSIPASASAIGAYTAQNSTRARSSEQWPDAIRPAMSGRTRGSFAGRKTPSSFAE
jgi:hypothetical protein